MRWSNDKQTRVLIGLVIGLHWVDIVKPILPDATFIWKLIEDTMPQTVFELRDLIYRHCRDIVSVVYYIALDSNE